jgi:hypothetical protein
MDNVTQFSTPGSSGNVFLQNPAASSLSVIAKEQTGEVLGEWNIDMADLNDWQDWIFLTNGVKPETHENLFCCSIF